MNSDDMYIKDICQGMTPYQCSQQIKADADLELKRVKSHTASTASFASTFTWESVKSSFQRLITGIRIRSADEK